MIPTKVPNDFLFVSSNVAFMFTSKVSFFHSNILCWSLVLHLSHISPYCFPYSFTFCRVPKKSQTSFVMPSLYLFFCIKSLHFLLFTSTTSQNFPRHHYWLNLSLLTTPRGFSKPKHHFPSQGHKFMCNFNGGWWRCPIFHECGGSILNANGDHK